MTSRSGRIVESFKKKEDAWMGRIDKEIERKKEQTQRIEHKRNIQSSPKH